MFLNIHFNGIYIDNLYSNIKFNLIPETKSDLHIKRQTIDRIVMHIPSSRLLLYIFAILLSKVQSNHQCLWEMIIHEKPAAVYHKLSLPVAVCAGSTLCAISSELN